jgi:hypothetical protein
MLIYDILSYTGIFNNWLSSRSRTVIAIFICWWWQHIPRTPLHIVCSASNLLNSTPLKTLCKLIDYPMKARHNYQAEQSRKIDSKDFAK